MQAESDWNRESRREDWRGTRTEGTTGGGTRSLGKKWGGEKVVARGEAPAADFG